MEENPIDARIGLPSLQQVDSNDQQSAQFEQWLLDIGQGKDLPLNHQFTMPQYIIFDLEVSDLTSVVIILN